MDVCERTFCRGSDFVTVVSIGSEKIDEKPNLEYVTVLTIGETENVPKEIVEQVLVYRLPGERLGFGLKFEGGTKAAEFVKRLFIQSCAPESPASRVCSSWGKLEEGDEVLEIDSTPIKTMTRIDCVRCLKDSNVVIKLLIRHNSNKSNDAIVESSQAGELKSRSTEDLPLVVSAEKKRTVPPPPPVPPRKIPRKLLKEPSPARDENDASPAPPIRHNYHEAKISHVPMPRNSGKLFQARQPPPEAVRHTYRRLPDGNLGPPSAEVYVDLFSQESVFSLSESDDTESSISTIVDRFGSFPTTSNSSLSGSIPSTPTTRQKHLDLPHVLTCLDNGDFEFDNEDYLFSQDNLKINEDKPMMISLQPPANFQDAPLSYGNEDVQLMEAAAIRNGIQRRGEEPVCPPFPPPRSKNFIEKNNNLMSKPCLPRLVDFVPKSPVDECQFYINSYLGTLELVKLFLENEKRVTGECRYPEEEPNRCYFSSDQEYCEEADYYNYKWNSLSQLTTIGEDEEENSQEFYHQRSSGNHTPTVVVENTDASGLTRLADEEIARQHVEETCQEFAVGTPTDPIDADANMDTPPSYSRQPPDGDEFPDFQENSITTKSVMDDVPVKLAHHHISRLLWKPIDTSSSHKDRDQSSRSVRDKIAAFSNPSLENYSNASLNKTYKSSEDIFYNSTDYEDARKFKVIRVKSFSNDKEIKVPVRTRSFLELNHQNNEENKNSDNAPPIERLHTRSQSLVDVSAPNFRSDRWSLLAEQRRKGLSKLKGLVIPEHVSEAEIQVQVMDLPEIKSSVVSASSVQVAPQPALRSHQRNSSTPSLSSLPWNTNVTGIPKYSPAFKRKSLQVYGTETNSEEQEKRVAKRSDDSRVSSNLSLCDAPKSLESITSPTRSDYSFEYVSSSPELKTTYKQETVFGIVPYESKQEDLRHSDDESDNDSAVSSSQSSYVSRNSPSPELNHNYEHEKCDGFNHRLLKPQSVEAINRKNILASAKCRSGRDLKIGSPLIQRKFEEEETNQEKNAPNEGEKRQLDDADDVTDLQKWIRSETKNMKLDAEKKIAAKVIQVPQARQRESIIDVKLRKTPSSTLTNNKVPTKTNSLVTNTKAASVTDLRKSFEILTVSAGTPAKPSFNNFVAVNTPKAEVKRNSVISLAKPENKLVEKPPTRETVVEPVADGKETIPQEDIQVVILHPELLGGSLGITLAGGVDYETKEITIHKIRNGSLAHLNGRLEKGDRILSINDKTMKGLTHAESVTILKERVAEVSLTVCKSKPNDIPKNTPQKKKTYDFPISAAQDKGEIKIKDDVLTEVLLVKDAAGVGFSLDGGQSSPQGDVPLIIKRIFKGGAAEKSNILKVGDILISINGINVSNMSRFETWALLKKLPEGDQITLAIRR